MSDLIEKMESARDALRSALDGKWDDKDAAKALVDATTNYAKILRAVLSTTSLTAEQIEGIASGEMVVVPREATEAMLRDGISAQAMVSESYPIKGLRAAYSAMIAAKETP